MKTTSSRLVSASIPEWDAEDEVNEVLAGGELARANAAESREMLDTLRLDLPRDIVWAALPEKETQTNPALAPAILKDIDYYDYHRIEFPLNIVVSEKQQLVRLRLLLELDTQKQERSKVAAYDLFPTDQIEAKDIMTGEVTLTLTTALKYILTATGAGAAANSLAECIGGTLSLPFKWTSYHTKVRSSDCMSNPVEWYLTDSSIQNGFTGHVIIRAPKQSTVVVTATLACEVRRSGLLGHILKAQFTMTEPRRYTLEH